MKRLILYALAVSLVLSAAPACKKKVEQAPPPPQVQEQPKVEKVEPPPVKPELTEEDIFAQKSLEQLNAEKPLAMIHFDYDKYAIRDDARPTLEANAGWLKKWRTTRVLIEGHCDERGTEEYNLALGEKRAQSTMEYLTSLGVPAERLRIISFGKSQPLDPASNEAAWGKNRRANFTVIEK